jgi:hypothetical protein
MRVPALIACAAAALALDITPLPPPAPGPASVVERAVAALRQTDLRPYLALLSAERRAALEQGWHTAALQPRVASALDAALTVITAPDAEARLIALGPTLRAAIQPQAMATQLQSGAAVVALLVDEAEHGTPARPVLAANLRAFAGVLEAAAVWVPAAGLDDEARWRRAVPHLIAAGRALHARTVPELRALPLSEALGRAAGAAAALKAALVEYGADVDEALAAIHVEAKPGDGPRRLLTVHGRFFGRDHAWQVPVRLDGETWLLDVPDHAPAPAPDPAPETAPPAPPALAR